MSDSSHEPPPSRPVHVPVLLREVLEHLQLTPDLTVVDGTVGAGGHSREILGRLGEKGRLIGLDRDAMMLNHAATRLSDSRVKLVKSSYSDLRRILDDLQIPHVDRVLLDLGLSSDQLADQQRGFSFHSDGPLDLRFDTTSGESAANYLARVQEDEFVHVLETYGEERKARQIAKRLVQVRSSSPIETGADLARVVLEALNQREQRAGATHPATRVFQALRIVVNQELDQVERMLTETLPACLPAGGVAVIISFHSLEDRIVKTALRHKTLWEAITPQPVTATPAEQRVNPRSRSALLRAARRL